MRKTLTVRDKEITFESSAITAIVYKKVFGEDLFSILGSDGTQASVAINILDKVQQLAFIMAKQAEGMDIKGLIKLNELDYLFWLNDFEYTDMRSDEFVADLLSIWSGNLETSVKGKNAAGTQ